MKEVGECPWCQGSLCTEKTVTPTPGPTSSTATLCLRLPSVPIMGPSTGMGLSVVMFITLSTVYYKYMTKNFSQNPSTNEGFFLIFFHNMCLMVLSNKSTALF